MATTQERLEFEAKERDYELLKARRWEEARNLRREASELPHIEEVPWSYGTRIFWHDQEVYKTLDDYDRHAHIWPIVFMPSVWRKLIQAQTLEEAKAAFSS